MNNSIEIQAIAFEGPKEPYRGYTAKVYRLKEPNEGDVLVEIFAGGKQVRKFTFPAYKMWNIAAHFHDIVDGEIEQSARGYAIAAYDGLGGYAPIESVE